MQVLTHIASTYCWLTLWIQRNSPSKHSARFSSRTLDREEDDASRMRAVIDGFELRKSLVKRFPFLTWLHRDLCEDALELGYTDQAYASALALQELGERGLALLFLGRVRLALHDPEQALIYFTKASPELTVTEKVTLIKFEAAAHLALGNFSKVVELLEKLPPRQRDNDSQMALDFAKEGRQRSPQPPDTNS